VTLSVTKFDQALDLKGRCEHALGQHKERKSLALKCQLRQISNTGLTAKCCPPMKGLRQARSHVCILGVGDTNVVRLWRVVPMMLLHESSAPGNTYICFRTDNLNFAVTRDTGLRIDQLESKTASVHADDKGTPKEGRRKRAWKGEQKEGALLDKVKHTPAGELPGVRDVCREVGSGWSTRRCGGQDEVGAGGAMSRI
jgi:hypothetical protein